MRSLSKFVLIIGFALSSFAYADVQNTGKNQKSNVYLSYCSHFGAGVSYSFQSCVNSNFSSVAQNIGGFFSYCSNFGNEVDYSFISCVNSGFREAERKLDNKIFLQDCMNFDREALGFSFVSCVNSNFSEIQRAIP